MDIKKSNPLRFFSHNPIHPLRFLSHNPILKAIMIDFSQHIRFKYIIDNIRILNESSFSKKNHLSMLDVGAGLGTLSNYILTEFKGSVINIEYSAQFKLENMIIADARELPFESDSFDIVVSTDVLEHITSNKQKFITELLRCSKYGVILTYSKLHHNNPSQSGIHIFETLYRKFPEWYIEHNQNEIIEDNLIINTIKDNAKITSEKSLSGILTLFFMGATYIFRTKYINFLLQTMGYLITRIIDPAPHYAFGATFVKLKKN